MGSEKNTGMKSAYDLAMERLEKRDGKLAPLSAEQKRALADVDQLAKAKTAEIELLFGPKWQAALATGKPEEIAEVDRQKRSELDRIRSQAEDEKERIRQGKG